MWSVTRKWSTNNKARLHTTFIPLKIQQSISQCTKTVYTLSMWDFISRARHFMQLHILQHKSPFAFKSLFFAFFAKLLKFSRKFEKWSCKWCKSAVKHKFRLNFHTFLEYFLLKHNIRWQKWQKKFKNLSKFVYPGWLLHNISLYLQENSIFGIKSVSLCKISLFAVNDLLFYLSELHIFPSPIYKWMHHFTSRAHLKRWPTFL